MRDVKMLDLSSKKSIKSLLKRANDANDIKEAIEYGFTIKDSSVVRNSYPEYDEEIAKHVCKLGFSGWSNKKIGKFLFFQKHASIAFLVYFLFRW